MTFTPIAIPSKVKVLQTKDIMLRDHFLIADELAIVIAYNQTTGIYTVQSQDGKRTNSNMQLHIDFKPWSTVS